MKNSIKKRILLSNCIVVLVATIIFQVVFAFGVKQFYYGGALRILTEKAVSNADFYNMYLKYDSIESKAKTILSNYTESDRAELRIVGTDGQIIASSAGIRHVEAIDAVSVKNLKLGEIKSWQGKIRATGEQVLAVASPLAEGETITGYLCLITSMEDIRAAVNNLVITALITGVLILVVAFILSAVLARSIVSPIKHLTDVSKQIAGGNPDVTAQKKYNDEIGELADTLNFMSEEIRKSNDLKNDFISSISHEIRTPLTSIRGWAETVYGSIPETDDNRQGIGIILKESKRLTALVEELLDFSKFESGRIEMQFEEFDFNVLIKDVLKQYGTKFREKNLLLSCNLDEEITGITGDSGRLKQVFINIIDNACKFSTAGGTITVSTKKIPDGVEAGIKDNGIGIPSGELHDVTKKFFKGKDRQAGSGLGLSISQEIIKQHKGIMQISSEVGKGTTVTIKLRKRIHH